MDLLVGRVEHALARHEIDLQPHAVGVLEQDRIISRRPAILLRRADDRRAQRLHEGMGLVDVFPGPGAEADMVQAHAPLDEPLALVFWRGRRHREAGPPAVLGRVCHSPAVNLRRIRFLQSKRALHPLEIEARP